MSRIFFYLIVCLFIAVCASALFFSIANAEPEINLIDPQEATDPLVTQGFKIMELTHQLAPQYANDRISCNNCHFNGGNTTGGSNGGISLVGVTEVYPRYSQRSGRSISLEERISNCFERSLNGKPVPANDPIMKALVAYLTWISQPAKGVKDKYWLGLKPIKSDHTPNQHVGFIQYEQHCASCHKSDGNGSHNEMGDSVPPLFGNSSFNDGAGMNNPQTFAAFIFLNMPQGQPYLTKAQALDIAEYVTKQPRPHFVAPR